MHKQEIIEILLIAKDAYEEAINAEKDFPADDTLSKYFFYLFSKHLAYGLCDFFENLERDTNLDTYPALSELNADSQRDYEEYLYWYTSVSSAKTNRDKVTKALQPRLDNIYRTIARLQQELQSEAEKVIRDVRDIDTTIEPIL